MDNPTKRTEPVEDTFEEANQALLRLASHRRIPVDLVRIFLGVALFVKGIQFSLSPTHVTEALTRGTWFESLPAAVVYYIAASHLVGGLLMAIGLWTRIGVLLQLPILFGATFVVSLPEGPLSYTHRFEFTAFVLFLLVMILFHGSGRLSIDHYRSKSRAGDRAALGMTEARRP